LPNTDSFFARAARILAVESGAPPDECDHGFRLPRDCPNEACSDRAVEWAWYVGHRGQEPFPLREADVEELERSAR